MCVCVCVQYVDYEWMTKLSKLGVSYLDRTYPLNIQHYSLRIMINLSQLSCQNTHTLFSRLGFKTVSPFSSPNDLKNSNI